MTSINNRTGTVVQFPNPIIELGWTSLYMYMGSFMYSLRIFINYLFLKIFYEELKKKKNF